MRILSSTGIHIDEAEECARRMRQLRDLAETFYVEMPKSLENLEALQEYFSDELRTIVRKADRMEAKLNQLCTGVVPAVTEQDVYSD